MHRKIVQSEYKHQYFRQIQLYSVRYKTLLILLLHQHSNPFRMRSKLWCIHALDSSDAIGEIAFVRYEYIILKHVTSFP